MSAQSPQAGKQYPKNQIYNNNYKPAFQAPSKSGQQKTITNLSGTSLADLTSSPKSSTRTIHPQIAILHERIEYLQKQLEMLTQLLSEEQSKKTVIDRLEKENRALLENLEKIEEISSILQTKLKKTEKNNEQLVNALKSVSDQLQNLKAQQQKEPNINESKSSKTKQQVQEDIIKLNDEISNVLAKLHTLNEDYQVLRDENDKMSQEKQQMGAKISQLEERLSQQLNISQRYKNEYEYCREEISLLKQEIQQVNELSIQKQKQIQEECSTKQKQYHEKCSQLQQELEKEKAKQSNKKQVQQEKSTLVQIKNVKIRSLQIDNEMLKREHDAKEQQLGNLSQNLRELQRELTSKNDSINQINEDYRLKIRTIERNYDNRIALLQQHIKDLKYIETKVSYLEQQNRMQLGQLREKQEKIYELESGLREGNNKQYMIRSLEEEIKVLRNKEQAKDVEIQSMQLKRMELSDELDDVKRKLSKVENQVRSTNEVKEKYGSELTAMKEKMKELMKLSEQQERHIRDIESEHESSKKKIFDISMIDTTNNHKLDDLEFNNKQLQKMLLKEKMDKDTQNKRYRQLLQDYKQLNHELTLQLQLYRDAKNVDHPFCPLDSSRDSRSVKYNRYKNTKEIKQDQSLLKKQLEMERSKYEGLRQKYEKILERQKGMDAKMGHLQKQQKQSQFLKIDNSSLKAQVTQLNIRIQEYKTMVDNLKRQAENRSTDAEKLRFSLQRQYESKMEVQRMQIINQYNALLRNRNVRIEPSEYHKMGEHSQHLFHRHQTQSPREHFSPPSFVTPELSKIRYHPEYKKLQQEYMKIHKQLLQLEQVYRKSITECKDQIQKLKIQNEYHRKTIDELHAEGYGLYQTNKNSRDSRQMSRWGEDREREIEEYRNKYEEINRNYQKLYEEYVAYRNNYPHTSDSYLTGANGDRLRQLLRPGNNSQKMVEQTEMSWLKKLIDDKLIELQITPREPASVIERAGWVIEKLSALLLQLRQDRDTLKNQKKQVQKQSDKLKVKLETLQYEKSHNLKQLAVAMEKYKYLEQKHLHLSQGAWISREKASDNIHYNSIDIPSLNLNKGHKNHGQYAENGVNSNEKDVHKHQAEIIREQRLALLRKYQKDIQNLEQS